MGGNERAAGRILVCVICVCLVSLFAFPSNVLIRTSMSPSAHAQGSVLVGLPSCEHGSRGCWGEEVQMGSRVFSADTER